MAFGVPKKPYVIRWDSSGIQRHMSARGDIAGPMYVSLLVPVGMANRGSRQFCLSAAFRHSTGFLVDLVGETAATFWAAQYGNGAQDASEAAPGLFRRIRGVLLLWRVDHVQDEGRGNQAHQARHQSCTRPRPSVRRLPHLAVQH